MVLTPPSSEALNPLFFNMQQSLQLHLGAAEKCSVCFCDPSVVLTSVTGGGLPGTAQVTSTSRI